ncbi:GNAT family N-acetyltransferase [Algibacter marinivivus]|nr:GNAT family N-acetyltransferase [Algibacter marinivivus]
MEGNSSNYFVRTRGRKSSSSLKKYWNVISNGLFLFGLRNRLEQIGININPYYWVEEEFAPCMEPRIKNDTSKYTLKDLSLKEVELVIEHHSAKDKAKLIKGFKNGQLCVGLENNGEIASFMFVEFNDFEHRGRAFKLKPNEAYLFNMWTFQNYRGKNLAPYLRYQTYRMLEKKGIDVKYSITQYFNKSSIKFKNKLNSKNHYLFLSVGLFNIFKWNFTLKKYS